MGSFKRLRSLFHLILIHHLFVICIAKRSSLIYCGETQIESPFLENSNSTVLSSLLSRMVLCKSKKLYFRTSIGLFPISSINYTSKLVTVTHPSSSSSHYISSSILLAGFPSPPEPNSLLLFNCSLKSLDMANIPFAHNGTHVAVDDLEKFEMRGLNPKALNCSNFHWAYRKSYGRGEGFMSYELGTRVSFDIPDHVPNVCDECQKPNGYCGAGLRCICHPQQCRDHIISRSGSLNMFGYIFIPILASAVLLMVS